MALSLLLAEKGFRPRLWGAFPQYVDEVRKKRENAKFLPGFKIPEPVELLSDITAACRGAEWIVLAAPSQYLRGVVKRLKKERLSIRGFVVVAKGIETHSLKVMSEVVQDELGRVKICVLSGPTIARDIALKMPAAASVASPDKAMASAVRDGC